MVGHVREGSQHDGEVPMREGMCDGAVAGSIHRGSETNCIFAYILLVC